MSINIGNIKANKGEKKTGFLTVAEMPTGTVDLPLTIINGTKSGPILVITAGVHGCEYPGIRGAQIIAREIKASELTGALIIVHNVNVPGFVHQTAFYNPFDVTNLNRIWPGDLESGGFYGAGSISHLIANAVHEKVQKKATHYIDLHGGDLPEDVPHFSACKMSGNSEVDDVSRAMVKYSLAKYIMTATISPGISRTTTDSAAKLKIPNVIHEIGRAGLLEKEKATKTAEAVRNIMKYLGMIEGKPIEPSKQIKIGPGVAIRAKHGGFFESFVEGGDIVSEGQTIGKIYNVFGETVEEVKAPKDGVILIVGVRPPKCAGDSLYNINDVVD